MSRDFDLPASARAALAIPFAFAVPAYALATTHGGTLADGLLAGALAILCSFCGYLMAHVLGAMPDRGLPCCVGSLIGGVAPVACCAAHALWGQPLAALWADLSACLAIQGVILLVGQAIANALLARRIARRRAADVN